MSADQDTLAPGTQLGHYLIEGVIGSGGMATVYLGRDARVPLPRADARRGLVALKVLHGHFASIPTYVERFAQEARAAAALHHRHVAEVLDVGAEGERPYLVMEYLPGETLADRLLRSRRLPIETIAAVMLPVVSAVSAAHAAGIIHRDLKPDNIILAREEGGGERPVLLDFGISKVLDPPGPATPATKTRALTLAGQVVGTPYYMSPEQIRSEDLDGRSDLYALGVILYECATGARPFKAEQSVFVLMAEILLGQPVPPSHLEPSIPGAFEAVVLRAMAPRREDRFNTADTLGRALLPFAGPEACRQWANAFGADPDDVEQITPVPAIAMERITVPSLPPRALVDPALVTQPAVPGPVPKSGDRISGADLGALPGFADLLPAELDAFCLVAAGRTLPKDGVLFAQGTTGDACFAIVRGTVEVSKTFDGTSMVLDVLGPGAFLGQDALVERATRSVTARATEDTVVVELTRDELQRLLGFHDRVALRFLELIAVSGIRQLRGGTRRLAGLLEARGLGQGAADGTEITGGTRPLEQLRAAVREWSVRLDER